MCFLPCRLGASVFLKERGVVRAVYWRKQERVLLRVWHPKGVLRGQPDLSWGAFLSCFISSVSFLRAELGGSGAWRSPAVQRRPCEPWGGRPVTLGQENPRWNSDCQTRSSGTHSTGSFYIFLIEVGLIYNVMLVSGVQQNDSAYILIYMHIHILISKHNVHYIIYNLYNINHIYYINNAYINIYVYGLPRWH